MKNTMKLFAVMMVMLCMLVAGCQSNEEKYMTLRTETVKLCEEIDKNDDKVIPKVGNSKVMRAAMRKALVMYDEKMPKIEENMKKMEELSNKDAKLKNDYETLKGTVVHKARHAYKWYKEDTAVKD